ncbi:hypothetical protein ACFV4P_23025 [Kitasatospora sp. NPDC059795]|uniref:hypothetical protein n=1 Tax=Kitasatospora sp. NPDC059795 TaxID=3346949 RepID=UPI00365B73AA
MGELTDRKDTGPGAASRLAWAALALFTAAFAIFEAVVHDWWTGLAGAALFAAALPTGPVGRHALPPTAVLVAYSLSPLEQPWIFTAALGWLTAVAVRRASAGRSRRCSTTG